MRQALPGTFLKGNDSQRRRHQEEAIHTAKGYADTRVLCCTDLDHSSSMRVATLPPTVTLSDAAVKLISLGPWPGGNQETSMANWLLTFRCLRLKQLLLFMVSRDDSQPNRCVHFLRVTA